VAKIFGGSASRLEVYALFAAAVVLIGGGVAGAVVVTSSGDETSTPVTVVETTSTTATTAVPVEVTAPSTTSAPINQPQLPSPRYVDPPPVTVTPDQPVQDFSAYCVMPDVLGIWTWRTPGYGVGGITHVGEAIRDAGCPFTNSGIVCYTDSLSGRGTTRVVSQDPSPGTLVHRSFGTINLVRQESSEGIGNPQDFPC
jgi:hypothetical protein